MQWTDYVVHHHDIHPNVLLHDHEYEHVLVDIWEIGTQ